MVTSTRTGSRLMIIAQPDQSSSWRTNKLIFAALCVPCMGIALIFTFMGAWPVLPFAGLELTALGAALYYVNRKLQFRQVITVSEDTVAVEQGFLTPQESWELHKDSTGMTIVPERYPWESPEVAIHDRSSSVVLGAFLRREDQLALIDLLRQEIRVRARARRADVSF